MDRAVSAGVWGWVSGVKIVRVCLARRVVEFKGIEYDL